MVKNLLSLLNKWLQSWCSTCCIYMGMTRRAASKQVAKSLELSYECPHSGSKCSVIGNISELVKHLKDDHDVHDRQFSSQPHDKYYFGHTLFQPGDMEISPGMFCVNPSGMLCVLNCCGPRFCYHMELVLHFGSVPCYIVFLRFMGEEIEAKKFRYSLEICKNDRKLTWEGVPRSIRDGHHEVLDTQDGLVIPRNLLLLLLDDSEQKLRLRIKGRIWKE